MKSVGLLIALLVVTVGFTQPPDTIWTRTCGGTGSDEGVSVAQTTDGGYVITGWTNSYGAGYHDVYLIKTNASGNVLWTKTYGGNDWDEGHSVAQTTDGGYIVTGWTWSYGSGEQDVWLIKTDASGDTIWTQTFGGTAVDGGSSVAQTTDGGYIITGRTESYGVGGMDVWLIKTDTTGEVTWTKTYGSADWDYGSCVAQTTDGGYVITGRRYGAGFYDVWLIKTDASGDTIWTQTFGGAETEWGSSVVQTTDGGYIIVGVRDCFGPESGNVWLIKTDATGSALWTKTFAGAGWSYGNSVAQTTDGGYIIAGHTSHYSTHLNDVWLIKTDASGDTIWTQTYGGDVYEDWGMSVAQTTDGGYIIAGVTESYGAGGEDVWLIKLEPDVGIEENELSLASAKAIPATILRGPLQLPEGKKCKVFDITGRVVQPDKIQPGIYFIEIDGVVTQKVVKVR